MASSKFSVEMAAENIRGNPDDYRDGVAAFVVQDMETAMIFDSIANGKHGYVVYERLHVPGVTSSEQAFTYVIDSPFVPVDYSEPGKYHEYSISLDTSDNSARWFVDKHLVFKACDIPTMPKSVRLGFGLFTLHPIIDGKSCSLRGQGMVGRWRNFKVGSSISIRKGI
jgi:hypothetical protein